MLLEVLLCKCCGLVSVLWESWLLHGYSSWTCRENLSSLSLCDIAQYTDEFMAYDALLPFLGSCPDQYYVWLSVPYGLLTPICYWSAFLSPPGVNYHPLQCLTLNKAVPMHPPIHIMLTLFLLCVCRWGIWILSIALCCSLVPHALLGEKRAWYILFKCHAWNLSMWSIQNAFCSPAFLGCTLNAGNTTSTHAWTVCTRLYFHPIKPVVQG